MLCEEEKAKRKAASGMIDTYSCCERLEGRGKKKKSVNERNKRLKSRLNFCYCQVKMKGSELTY